VLLKKAKNALDFKNASKSFAEVIFTVDGMDIRTGEPYSSSLKGYCYPPGYQKEISAKLSPGATVIVYVYEGEGRESTDYDKPAFLRQGEKRKAIFHRSSNRPSKIIELVV